MIIKDASNTGTDERGISTSLKSVQDYAFLVKKLFELAGPKPTFYEERNLDASKVGEVLVNIGPKIRFVSRELWFNDVPREKGTVVLVDASRHAAQTCDAVICRKVLPLHIIKNVLHIGLTCIRPMGAFGEPIISAPFAFVTDPTSFARFSYERENLEFSMKLRPMASLLAGKEEISVVWEDVGKFGDIVWFPLEMVCDLLGERQMEDASTIILLRWADAHEAMLRRKAYSRDEYSVVELPKGQVPTASIDSEEA